MGEAHEGDSGGVADQTDAEEDFAVRAIGQDSGGITEEGVNDAVDGDDEGNFLHAAAAQVVAHEQVEGDEHGAEGVGEGVEEDAEGEGDSAVKRSVGKMRR